VIKLANFRISTRFTLIIGGIFTIFYIFFALLVFLYMKERAISDANEKARIVLDIMD
jgi:hypothetical protein